jgi:hypothetical protein
MHSQTKAVAIAGAVGLVFGFLSEVPSVASRGFVEPLDTLNPFNGGVLGHWTGALGIFPFIAILITAAATARKAGALHTILSGLGAILGVWLTICIVVIATAALYPQKELPLVGASPARADFLRTAISSCAAARQASPEGKDLSAATITTFCTCAANTVAEVITRDELQYFQQHQALMPSAIAKFGAARDKCLQAGDVRGK